MPRSPYLQLTALVLVIVPQIGMAGEAVVERKQFKQSSTYPYVFRPECYLATTGPVPLRFAPGPPHCPERVVPPFPVTPKVEANSAVVPAPKVEPPPPPVPPPVAPAHPVPDNAPVPPHGELDLNRVPDEVLDFFRSTEGRTVTRNYLFDPIFQPALPNELPKSKATYQQK